MNNQTSDPTSNNPSRGMIIGLWTAQVLIFLPFVIIGAMKIFMPVDQLAAMWAWPGEYPVWFLRGIGVIDVAGGVGVLLPALTKIKPGLTIVAAWCSLVLQICAIAFHFSRGEADHTPLNWILVGLLVFVLWGRTKVAPLRLAS